MANRGARAGPVIPPLTDLPAPKRACVLGFKTADHSMTGVHISKSWDGTCALDVHPVFEGLSAGVMEDSAQISGRVTDPLFGADGVEVYLNGSSVAVDSDGAFSQSIPQASGTSMSLMLSARNRSGNWGTAGATMLPEGAVTALPRIPSSSAEAV